MWCCVRWSFRKVHEPVGSEIFDNCVWFFESRSSLIFARIYSKSTNYMPEKRRPECMAIFLIARSLTVFFQIIVDVLLASLVRGELDWQQTTTTIIISKQRQAPRTKSILSCYWWSLAPLYGTESAYRGGQRVCGGAAVSFEPIIYGLWWPIRITSINREVPTIHWITGATT